MYEKERIKMFASFGIIYVILEITNFGIGTKVLKFFIWKIL